MPILCILFALSLVASCDQIQSNKAKHLTYCFFRLVAYEVPPLWAFAAFNFASGKGSCICTKVTF